MNKNIISNITRVFNFGRFLIFLPFFLMILSASFAYAALNLSVNPLSGGSSIRLGRAVTSIASGEEVRIRVTSSDGAQYQVYQRLLDPLTNEKGMTLPVDSLITSTIQGSNASGTMYLQNIEPLSFSDQLIFTSSPDGSSDAFTIVYAIDPKSVNASGRFNGQIEYVLRPVNGGGHQTVILNVFCEIENRFVFSVEGSRNKDTVHLKPVEEGMSQEFIGIEYKDSVGPVSVFQELVVPFQNERLEPLNEAMVKYQISSGQEDGVAARAPEVLTRKRTLVFESSESENTFDVAFFLQEEALAKVKAGRYRGQLKYAIEHAETVDERLIDLELNIDPIFDLKTQLPPEGVKFSGLLPTSEPKFSEVEVVVTSNTGQPYVVSQNTASRLTNEKGDAIEEEHFNMKVELLDESKGKSAVGDFMPVKSGDMPLYFSDSQGSSARFKVVYRLRAFPGMAPGDYTTLIKYSFGEK